MKILRIIFKFILYIYKWLFVTDYSTINKNVTTMVKEQIVLT